MPVTVQELILKLQMHVASSAQNGTAIVCLRAPDGETCFAEFNALDGASSGQSLLCFAPMGGEFKMVDMKSN